VKTVKIKGRFLQNLNSKRTWTVNDLKFTSPTMNKLEAIRPPYDVQMEGGDKGKADPPTGTNGQPLPGTWRYVEMVGINVSTGQKESIRVGRVWDHWYFIRLSI
jgi:hypothetical protein